MEREGFVEKVRKLVEENPVLFNKEAIKKVEEEEVKSAAPNAGGGRKKKEKA